MCSVASPLLFQFSVRFVICKLISAKALVKRLMKLLYLLFLSKNTQMLFFFFVLIVAV